MPWRLSNTPYGMLCNLNLADILPVRRLCLSQARGLSRSLRSGTVSADTAMTQQADKGLPRQTVKQKLRECSVEHMQSESKHCPLYAQSKRLLWRGGAGNSCLQLIRTQQCAGKAIAKQILHSSYYQHATRLGVYLHCAKLREVDTTAVVAAAVKAGEDLLSC